MALPFVDELKLLENKGVHAYDAFLQATVLVVAPVICIPCDNPQASEVTNNLGTSAKMFCRICMVCDTLKQVCSVSGEITAHFLFQCNRDNDPTTLAELRTKDHTLKEIAHISSQCTVRQKAALQTQYGVTNTPNAFLELPLDLHKYENVIFGVIRFVCFHAVTQWHNVF